MKRILSLTVILLCLLFNSALAMTPVQMNDDYSLYDIIQKYNQYGSNVDDDTTAYMIPNSFSKWHDTFLPDTTTYYSQNFLSGITAFVSLNGQGKVVVFAVNVDRTRDKTDCAIVASRFIHIIDGSCEYKDVIHKCYVAMTTGERQMLYSNAAKRYYVISSNTIEDGYQCIVFSVA